MSSHGTSVEPSSSDIRKSIQFNEYLLLDEDSIQLSLRTGMQPETESKKLKADDDDLLLRLNDIIIYEILTRVPLETLIQWRCVCKEWTNIIINPSFGYLHSRRNTYNNPGLIFYSTRDATRDDYDYYEGTPHLVFFDVNKTEERDIRLPPELENDFQGKEVMILHSLNGLLLISCCSHDIIDKMVNYYVCNPITGRSTILPVLDLEVAWGKDSYLTLAFGSVMSKYKVVCSGYAKDKYYCKIVDINVGAAGCSYSWRDVTFPKSCNRLPRDHPPVFANGYLHWMFGGIRGIWNLDGSYSLEPAEQDRKILRLDVRTELFDTIRYPGCYSGGSNYTLLEMRGLLCYVHHVSDLQLKFLVLNKDSNNNDEWVEECSVDMGHLRNILPFVGFIFDCRPFAILCTDTKRKLIFWYFGWDYHDAHYLFRYYSYDMDLNHLELIYEPLDNDAIDWHVNTLACF